MSYVVQGVQIVAGCAFIFRLLCYCLGNHRPQAATWTKVTEGQAGPEWGEERRGGDEGNRRAGRGQARAREAGRGGGGQRARRLSEEMRGAELRGRRDTESDTPQRPQRPRNCHPHPTRLPPTFSQQTYRYPKIPPPSKDFCENVNQRTRYQLLAPR